MKSIRWGIGFVGLSIILGAFGAHTFKSILSAEHLQSYKTGVNYLMFMGLGLLALSALQSRFSSKSFNSSITLIVLGTLLFSISIFILVFMKHSGLSTGLTLLGPITPIGGVLMIVGWSKLLFTKNKQIV